MRGSSRRCGEGFRAGAGVPARHHHPVPRPGQEPAILLLMPAWREGDVTGVKLVHIARGNETKGLPSVQGLYVLFDGPTGTPLAVMDGAALTTRRTAAASALAASYLARPDARVLTMVGAGAMAPHLARAHAAVRPIAEVRLWNRSRPRAEAVAAELAADAMQVVVVEDLEAAVRSADIVSCATHEPGAAGARRLAAARDACRPGRWLHGGDARERRCGDAPWRGVRRHVRGRAGGGWRHPARDPLRRADPRAASGGAAWPVRGLHPGRTDRAAITVFKSVGTALEDLVAAAMVHRTVAQGD